jgi:hypothetical protein
VARCHEVQFYSNDSLFLERRTDRLLTIQQVEIPKSLPHFEIDGDKRIYQHLSGSERPGLSERSKAIRSNVVSDYATIRPLTS